MTEHVAIFDTTLRDGEQSPGATMTRAEKIRIARALDVAGVDVIEAGFPAASPGEIEAVADIAAAVERASIAALCRTREGDIDAAWKALRHAARPRLHVFIATSDIHLQHKLRMSRDEVLAEIARGVAACRSLCADVEFSAEDATRSDLEFLCDAFRCAVEHGATVLNVPDTVGYTMPDEYTRIISAVRDAVGPDVTLSAHCHDDLGVAVANSLAAISAGARQVECCINGIGERAGNAALEELVMALRTRRDLHGVDSRVDATRLVGLSRLVSDVTGIVVQPNKAIVGRNAFAHEAGIHQHGVLQERTTYEIMDPADVGHAESRLVLGKHSGRHALRDRLQTLGYRVDDEHLADVFRRFKKLADKKKHIYDDDLHALVIDAQLRTSRHYDLQAIACTSGSHMTPTAQVSVAVGDAIVHAAATGDGPVNAAIEAIKQATGQTGVELQQYTLSAVTEGSDAQGRVFVRIADDGHVAHGQATHTDVVIASARAFCDALNHRWYQDQLAAARTVASEARV